MVTDWFDDIAVGAQFSTRARTITEADLVQFAMFSGDWTPLHTDVETARAGPFGERIAHGMLVLSVATGLVELQRPYILAFYGMDRVRFIRPVKIGDTLHVHSSVVDKTPRDAASGVISFDVRVRNQRSEDVVVTTMKMVVARRQA